MDHFSSLTAIVMLLCITKPLVLQWNYDVSRDMFMLIYGNLFLRDYQFYLEKEKQLQLEVNKGHQPWRLEPVDVAHAALIASINIKVPFEKCRLLSESKREAIVKCTDIKNYTVTLKQLIQTKGIWTATEIRFGE